MRIFIALCILCFVLNTTANTVIDFKFGDGNPANIHWNNHQTAFIEFAPPWGNYYSLVSTGYLKPINDKQTLSVLLFIDKADTVVYSQVKNLNGDIINSYSDTIIYNEKRIELTYSNAFFERLSVGSTLRFNSLKSKNDNGWFIVPLQTESDLMFDLGTSFKINNHKMATNIIGLSIHNLLNYSTSEGKPHTFSPRYQIHYRGEFFKQYIIVETYWGLELHDSSSGGFPIAAKIMLEGRITQYASIYGKIGTGRTCFGVSGNIPINKYIEMLRIYYELQDILDKSSGDLEARWRQRFSVSMEFGKNRNIL